MRSRRRVTTNKAGSILATLSLWFWWLSCVSVGAQILGEGGHPSCPCLSEQAMKGMNIPHHDVIGVGGDDKQGPLLSNYYGIGCHQHDINTDLCLEDSPCAKQKRMVIPPPVGCDTSWCQRHWCFVDPNNCTLAHRRSNFVVGRYFSYATCGDIDSFTNEHRFASLEGQEFRVGLNSNSGGWLGAYSRDKVHFEGPMDKWSGLAMDYVTSAALKGNFQFRIEEPPEFLWNQSVDYFQSESKFDFCVFATSLGYLDMCIAQYTVTDQRAASTDWLLTGSAGMYVVVSSDVTSSGANWDYYLESVSVIFSPFTPATWYFVIFFFIPLLGCLMVVHERGSGGSSAYPSDEVVLVTNNKTGESEVKRIPIPLYRTCIRSIYMAFLAVLQQTYDPAVTTHGAMLNLLGIAFFILTIVAVYTANLAAILTQNVRTTSISDLGEAVEAGYRFCCERKNMESVLKVHQALDAGMFAVDPPELGGDGEPGFSCTGCASRMRVFDFLDPVKAAFDSRYCHAAIAPEEDLEVLLGKGIHCNKTIVGKPLQMVQTGMPIFEHVSPQLISFFLKLMNDGEYDAALVNNRPESKCSRSIEQSEGSALNLAQLSGIWVVSAGFAILGLIVAIFQNRAKKKKAKSNKKQIRRIYKRDQRGGRIDALGLQDSMMAGGIDNNKLGLLRGSVWSAGESSYAWMEPSKQYDAIRNLEARASLLSKPVATVQRTSVSGTAELSSFDLFDMSQESSLQISPSNADAVSSPGVDNRNVKRRCSVKTKAESRGGLDHGKGSSEAEITTVAKEPTLEATSSHVNPSVVTAGCETNPLNYYFE